MADRNYIAKLSITGFEPERLSLKWLREGGSIPPRKAITPRVVTWRVSAPDMATARAVAMKYNPGPFGIRRLELISLEEAPLCRSEAKRLHAASFANAVDVERSAEVGCMGCCQIYPASEVRVWIPEEGARRTAICPRCGVDAVLSDAAVDFDRRTLQELHARYF